MYVKYFDILKGTFYGRKNELCKDNMGALLPPVIAIIFALKTKEVYISLLIGVVSGTLLLTNFHLVESLNLLFDTVVNCLVKTF